MTQRKEFTEIIIVGSGFDPLLFNGKYCPERETKNWHYYMRDDGIIIHYRKDGKGYIIGGTYSDLCDALAIKEERVLS